MAASNQTTFSAPGATGADQNILNKLNSTGQNPFNDLTLFNSNRVDQLMSNYVANNPERVTGIQVSKDNMPNSSQSSIDLANMVFKLNDQTYNTNAQNITTQENKSLNTLTQNTKDQNTQALQLFGASSLISPDQSSRNRSYVTDIGVQGQKAAMDIQNQAQTQISQLALGYAQNNVNAFTQARQLDLQDKQIADQEKQFDFNKAVTEAGLTGSYNGNRTLQGLQFDQNTINNKLQQVLSLSSLTGKMPNLTNVSSDLQSQLTYQNSSTTPLTLQGQSSQIGLEGAKAQLLQTRANLGLGVNGLDSSLKPAGASDAWDYSTTPAGKLNSAQIETALVTAQADKMKQQYILDSYSGQTGISGPMATLISKTQDLNSQYKEALNSPNPDNDKIKSLMSEWNDISKQIAGYQGSANKIYYNAQGSRIIDKNGLPATDYSSDGVNNSYIKGSLAKTGLDGDAVFSAPENPSLNAQMPAIQAAFSEELKKAITSGNSADAINKVFYSTAGGDQAILGLRQPGADGKAGNSYQFEQIDMTGMNAADRAKLQNAISEGKTVDGKTITDNTPEGLQNLQNIIKEYADKSGLKLQPLYVSDVINKLKTDNNYKDTANNIIYNDGKTQLTNIELLPMLLSGATPGGLNLAKNDFGGGQLRTLFTNYNKFYNQAQQLGVTNEEMPYLIGSPKDFPALPDGTVNPFKNTDNQKSLSDLSTWYDSLSTQTNQGQANQYTRAFVSAYSAVNGNDVSDNYITSLVNYKNIPGNPSEKIKAIQNKYGINAKSATLDLNNI